MAEETKSHRIAIQLDGLVLEDIVKIKKETGIGTFNKCLMQLIQRGIAARKMEKAEAGCLGVGLKEKKGMKKALGTKTC